MDTSTPPQVLPALVEWLEKLFPDRIPTYDDRHRLELRIGEQNVIRKLRQVMQEQREASLTSGAKEAE